MLRAILTTTALLCIAQAASAQEMTAEQRSACMGDYEKYCKGVRGGAYRCCEETTRSPSLQELRKRSRKNFQDLNINH